MIVGVDLDNTLSMTVEALVDRMRKAGMTLEPEDLVHDGTGLTDRHGRFTWKDVREYWWEDNDWLDDIDLQPGARAILALLPSSEIHLITARGRDAFDKVQPWLDKHGIVIDSVTSATDKATVCRQKGVQVMIEDHEEGAMELAQSGIPVLLKDHHYNRHIEHPRISRFSHWLEVPRLLRRNHE